MRILLSYGYHIGTTGFYFERALKQNHTVLFCGISNSLEKPGLRFDVDLKDILDVYGTDWDLFLWIDSYIPCIPRGIETLPFPTACYLVDVPYHPETYKPIIPFFDYIFFAGMDPQKWFRNIDQPTFWLPLACDPEIHKDLHTERIYDVAAIGGHSGGRLAILNELANYFHMNEYKKWYAPDEITEVYSRAKIVINLSLPLHIGMRIFEGMSCGALLVTGNNCDTGLNQLFTSGEHLVIYEHTSDLISIIKYYLDNDRVRESIAQNGKSLVLSKHTYTHRANELMKIISEHGFSMYAPARLESSKKLLRRYVKLYASRGRIDSAMDIFSKYNIKQIDVLSYLIIFKAFVRKMFQQIKTNLSIFR